MDACGAGSTYKFETEEILMIRYVFLALPYLLQLLCLIHILKSHKDTFWIWIIIMIPYAGGIAYLLVELLPSVISRRRVYKIQNKIANIIRPGKNLETLHQNSIFSPTHENLMDYADALYNNGNFDKALDIYTKQNNGIFKNDPNLIYKISLSLYYLNKYKDALQILLPLKTKNSNIKIKIDLLYLLIIENFEEHEKIKNEYEIAIKKNQDKEITIQYIKYLAYKSDKTELDVIFRNLHSEEDNLKARRINYNRKVYIDAFKIEKSINNSKI